MSGFEALHHGVQQWVWSQGWKRLRPIQEQAIEPILRRERDILIAAPTAGGKTEAAFLPIASQLAERSGQGVLALCVSPLKALINDQARRLEPLFQCVHLTLQPWHGDVSSGRSRFWKSPSAVLLITPESLEAMLMHRASEASVVFAMLEYIVVDELHAFVGTTRGAQLLSLLRRLECLTGRTPMRIGLSATLGDPTAAAAYLRPGGGRETTCITGESAGAQIRVGMLTLLPPDPMRVSGLAPELIDPSEMDGDEEPFSPAPPPATAVEAEASAVAQLEAESTALKDGLQRIADHLFTRTRGQTNLVFANARSRVELLTDELVSRAESMGLPVEAFAHHGSLSREHRAEVETRLREGQLPTTVVCTSTLELGIDIGDIDTVAQVGPAPTVAALKQRVGRSGRRAGQAQILRQYVDLTRYAGRYEVLASLQLPLIQSIASIQGLLMGRFETPSANDWHLSTLVQQILSRIVQGNRGERAQPLFQELCGPSAAFHSVDASTFGEVLRSMGAAELIEQIGDGSLLPGRVGEALAKHYTFYATFFTPEEYRVIGPHGRVLGKLPLEVAISEGQLIVLAGRRWRVVAIDALQKHLVVEPGPRGRPPGFGGGGLEVGSWVHGRMRTILETDSVDAYIDNTGAEVLASARAAYRAARLGAVPIAPQGDYVAVFHWAGSAAGATLAALLAEHGLATEQAGPAVLAHQSTVPAVESALADSLAGLPATVDELAPLFAPMPEQKFDEFLAPNLLQRAYARRHVDLDEVRRLLNSLARGH